MKTRTALRALLFSLPLVVVGCGGGSASGSGASSSPVGPGTPGGGSGGGSTATGTLQLVATDMPFDLDLVEEAIVRIDRIRWHADGSAEDDEDYDGDEHDGMGDDDGDGYPDAKVDGGGFVVIEFANPLELDLVELRNGRTKFMISANVPASSYRQVRLHVASADILLVNGATYSTSDGTLKLASQTKSGFKVFVDPPIEVVADEMNEVLLDFDLSKTFKPIPPVHPLTANFYMLHPVLRAVSVDETGEIDGVVEEDDPAGGVRPVDGAMVHLFEPGELDPSKSLATTLTEPDGSFTFLGVRPGIYDVAAEEDGASGRDEGLDVLAESTTTANPFLE